MESPLSSNVIQNESEWFINQTDLIDKTDVRYEIPAEQIKDFVVNAYSNRANFRPTGAINQSNFLESVMRRCFRRCNKFVLEDWTDYSELDCTLKCSIQYKRAFQLLSEVNSNI